MTVTTVFAELTHSLPNFTRSEPWRQLHEPLFHFAYAFWAVFHANKQQAVYFWQPSDFAIVWLAISIPFHINHPASCLP